ncbi:MAG: hypothetical protein WBY94_08105 [Polyangiaceae bacterium]
MNRYARRVVTCASIISAVALVPVGAAFAQDASTEQQRQPRAHRGGLLAAALQLDSLTADQRTAIEGLKAQRRASAVPVRAANAQVLTILAQEVEQGAVDPKALAPALSAEDSAAAAESAAEESAMKQLHALLTPAQRGQLVDAVEASAGQAPGDRGGAHHGHRSGNRGGEGAWGAKLGLTPEQKAKIAANLAAEKAEQAGQAGAVDGGSRTHEAALAARRQALESFRGDSFDAAALVRVQHRGDRIEKIAEAMVPVLTPAQRATWASGLRSRGAHESRS